MSTIDPYKIWTVVLGELEMLISPANYNTWIKQSRLLTSEPGMWTLAVPNGFCKTRIETKYQPIIEKTLSQHLGEMTKIACKIVAVTPAEAPPRGMFAATENAQASLAQNSASGSPGMSNVGMDGIKRPAPSQSGLPPLHAYLNGKGNSAASSRYTFDNYVVGDNNKLAHAAAVAVAEQPGEAYNPLFLYGGVGLGKTHLMHAIAKRVLAKFPQAKILYETSEKFTNDLISSIRTNQTEQFRAKYRSANVLLIDDIQFIAGKDSTQEEFFHTFNELYNSGSQIVLSSDRPPKAIPTLEDRLKSRFGAGLIADIQKASFETRMAILVAKSRSLNIPEDVLVVIAERVTSNIRELEGALNMVLTHSKVHNLPLTRDVAENILVTYKDTAAPKKIHPDKILQAIASYYNLPAEEITGISRKKEVMLPRQIAMYLMRDLSKLSLSQIGAEFGGKDHTTVMHSCQKIEDQLLTDDTLKNEIDIIEQKVYT